MAGLQADILSADFLKNFLPETVYLVPEDVAAYTSAAAPAPIPEPLATNAPEQSITTPVQPAEAPAMPVLPGAAATPQNFDVIGKNRKGVAILVTLPEPDFKALPQLEFLQKILAAIGLQTDDVAYVNNVSGQVAVFEELQKVLPIKYIISFASRINTNLPHDKFILYAPVKVADVPVVFSHDLKMIEQDIELKKKLWNSLRQTFEV